MSFILSLSSKSSYCFFFQGNTLGLVKPASSEYGKGTTVIAVIGETGIYVAADGRIIHDKGNIVDGSGQKIFLLGSNMCFAFAGCVYLANELLHKVKGVVANCVVERKIFRAKAKCERYIKGWMMKKENKNKKFPTLVLLCGYVKGKPHIFVVGPTADCSSGSEVGYIKAIGSGMGWAEDFVVEELSKGGNLGKYDYEQCVIRAVVVACLHSGGSGGRIRPAIVTHSAVEFPNPCHHIIRHLFADYARLKVYLLTMHVSEEKINNRLYFPNIGRSQGDCVGNCLNLGDRNSSFLICLIFKILC